MTERATLPEPGEPLETNVRGAAYPRLVDGALVLRVHASQARRVQLSAPGDSLGAEPVAMHSDADGSWTTTIPSPAPGFHYYRFEIDGLLVNDPNSKTYFGYGRSVSGLEIPEPGNEICQLKDFPHGVPNSTYFSPDTGHEWATWRRSIAEFGPMPFH